MRTRPFNTILIFLFSAYIQYGFSQFNPYYNFKHLNVENGLVQNIVYHFLQDSQGYMWLGTRNGITVYDGIRTINFQHNEKKKKIHSEEILSHRILEDSDHLIWIGNDAGIDLYNRADNNFAHFSITRTMAGRKTAIVYYWDSAIGTNCGLSIQSPKQSEFSIQKQKNSKLVLRRMQLTG